MYRVDFSMGSEILHHTGEYRVSTQRFPDDEVLVVAVWDVHSNLVSSWVIDYNELYPDENILWR